MRPTAWRDTLQANVQHRAVTEGPETRMRENPDLLECGNSSGCVEGGAGEGVDGQHLLQHLPRHLHHPPPTSPCRLSVSLVAGRFNWCLENAD